VAEIGDLNKLLSLDPKEPDPDVLITRAMAYYYAGYPDKGQPDADQAIALSPKDAELYKYRSYIDEGREQRDAAISDISQAIKYSKRKKEDLYYRRGWDYQAKADYDKAIDDYNEAAKINSSDMRIFRQRAQVYTSTGQLDLAAADLARIKPPSMEDFMARGAFHEDAGKYELALEDYNQAIAEAPNDWVPVNAAAWLLSTCPDAKVRDAKRALTLAKKACDISSWKDGDVIDTLAAALAETGDFAQAVTWQERAVELIKAQSPSADQQKEEDARLDLYRKGQPYRQPPPKK
jgi:tetratricopeptide (TPR) repeat protein